MELHFGPARSESVAARTCSSNFINVASRLLCISLYVRIPSLCYKQRHYWVLPGYCWTSELHGLDERPKSRFKTNTDLPGGQPETFNSQGIFGDSVYRCKTRAHPNETEVVQ